MKAKQAAEIFGSIDPNEEIAVIFYQREEFETSDGEMPSKKVWNAAMKRFDAESAMSSMDQQIMERLIEIIDEENG